MDQGGLRLGSLSAISITIDPYTILVWAVIGLVAGFIASKLMLGHGMGLIGDIVVGIIGAFAAGLLAEAFRVTFDVPGHPIVSEIVLAFLGAVVLLLIVRMFRPRRRFGRF
jgi:uncharacterized membrane protein YeaQ/YmgE (transglycosylase-associated protein family)